MKQIQQIAQATEEPTLNIGWDITCTWRMSEFRDLSVIFHWNMADSRYFWPYYRYWRIWSTYYATIDLWLQHIKVVEEVYASMWINSRLRVASVMPILSDCVAFRMFYPPRDRKFYPSFCCPFHPMQMPSKLYMSYIKRSKRWTHLHLTHPILFCTM